MSRVVLIVLAGLLALPVATAAIPGIGLGWGAWDHEDASTGFSFSCRGTAAMSGVRNAVPYGTLTLTFTFQARSNVGNLDDCARTPEALPPTTLVWTDATQDDDGRMTATRAGPCVTTTITLEPGWSGAFHRFTVERTRACFGPVTDTFRGVVN